MSTVLDVADAVVASLNGASFSQALTAERAYQPTFDLQEMQSLHVSVVPRSVAIDAASRSGVFLDCTIDVGVQKKINAGTEELDGLMRLVQEIVDHLRFRSLDSVAGKWLRIANDPVFAPEHLDQMRQFTSVISVTYRVAR